MKYNVISFVLFIFIVLLVGVVNVKVVFDDEVIEKFIVSGECLNNYLYEKVDSLF